MKNGSKIVIRNFVLAILLLFTTVSIHAERPWYAAKLENLGFYIYQTPVKQKDFVVDSLSGGSFKRSSLQGKIVLLNFWATWCPPCREEIPSIQNLAKTLKGKNFEVMAISVGESKTTVANFVKEKKIEFPIYLDPKRNLSPVYASRGIPTTYVLDKNGDFIAVIIGSTKYDTPEAISIFTELVSR